MHAATPRERDYIAAMKAFYGGKGDFYARAGAYSKGMEKVYERNPEDHEAAVFYALSILAANEGNDPTFAAEKKAAAILEKLFATEPDHPGVAHYLIHSFDYPQLATLALTAARSYARIAPSSPHALHMPSHIFTRLGLWQESIESNIASAEAARSYVAKTHPGAASFDQLHAMDYLTYAYLQTAQDGKVKEIVDTLYAINKVDANTVAAAYGFAAIPARYALERNRWSEAASLREHPADFPWNDFRYAEAIIYFARALGAAGLVPFFAPARALVSRALRRWRHRESPA